MRIGRRRREEAEVESSSLNDIMFFLMLFFLIASTLANPNVFPVNLPKSKDKTDRVLPKTVPLTVTKDLHVYIEQREVAYDELEAELKKLKEQFKNPDSKDGGLNIVLRIDSELKVQDLVDVMQVGANLGIKMVLATDKSK
ncbi:MAG: biopolymer transporter ExbD [Bacteroidetes bacterium]|nr:biopolymer transporter ExbD [Bacteroidota bacterium]